MGDKLRFIKEIYRRFSIRESLVFLFFLVLASLIWYGHAMNSVRSARLPVTVVYKGIPEDILFSDTLPEVIYIEARDAGKRLKAYRGNLDVTFDLSSQIKGESGQVHVSADLLRNSINTILQGTTKLQLIQPEQISGSYYRQHSKKVPVRLQYAAVPAAQYQLVGEPQIKPKKINIFGSRQQLDTIKAVETNLLTINEIKDTVQATTTLNVPAGIRVIDTEVSATFIAEQFTEKVLTLPIVAHCVPGKTHLKLFPSEATVHLRVGIAHFNDVDERNVEVYCDFPQAPADKLPLNIKCNCPYVTYSRCTPTSVEFLIEK